MEESVHDLTLKMRQQKKLMTTANVYDTVGFCLVKNQVLKVESRFFLDNYPWIKIILMIFLMMKITRK